MRKDSSSLYSLLADVLDCDYGRLADAFEDVDDEILSESIIECRDDECLSLDDIMQNVLQNALDECENSFKAEAGEKIEELDEDSEEFEVLDNFDFDCFKDDFSYDDGFQWNAYECTEDEMKIYREYLTDSFEKLIELIGDINDLPEV